MSETEYSYALQYRWKGERLWNVFTSRYSNPDEARTERERIKKNTKIIEMRIVRRPEPEWEVVE